ncbi:uncharacterized protein BJ212DRAFT_1480649 [Suillus subaureus]|uniref:Uncharacterized protein n=1 Tax=Suillus subaureus TaxID=48587 RepID=A0A9P7JDI4_9AGAM|nr:uncharacterized protein BJ212DRAFT_1480649 [Suillus subaureus]KAG1816796.1 hypothetical protein BJ212DRAFT_1480649 [Suillus subaureus]
MAITHEMFPPIVEKAGLLSDIADATSRSVPKMKGSRQIPAGFFDDTLRDAHLRTHRFSFWRRSKPHGATERDTQPRSHPLSWTRNIVSGMMRRRDGSDIQLQEVEVPYTAGKPRNYHARKKKPATSSSRPPKTHPTQQHSGATQNIPSSSQLPPPTATASPHTTIRVTGWRSRFMVWLCCIPIQNTGGQP